MDDGIGFLVRVFSQEKYRDDFLKGNLYMNPIKFFREYEDKHSGNVGDKHEGVAAWLQPANLRITFKTSDGEFVIPGSDIAEPVALNVKSFDSINVFCMTVLHSHGITSDSLISDEDFDKLKSYFTLPEDVNNLGEYAVVIPNAPLFLERVNMAGMRLIEAGEAKTIRSKNVTYYDPDESLSLSNVNDAIFHKQKSYEHQKEYRISLDRGVDEAESYTLKIGDISDIAFPVKTSDINKLVQLEKIPVSE